MNRLRHRKAATGYRGSKRFSLYISPFDPGVVEPSTGRNQSPSLVHQDSLTLSHSHPITFWPNNSTPEVRQDQVPARPRHIPIDISYLQQRELVAAADDQPLLVPNEKSSLGSPQHELQSISVAPRRKYVPIVIPAAYDPCFSPPPSDSEATPVDPNPRASFPRRLSGTLSPICASSGRSCETREDKFADMNGTQTNSQAQEPYQDSNSQSRPSNSTPANAGASTTGGQGGLPVGGTGPSNLSSLVCNVHRTTGREPHALVGATTTILGDRLYVFGGKILSRSRPMLTADLYELDLIRRHWTKLETMGDIPPPRYFHSVCGLGDTKLVCYGGMSPVPPSSTQSASSAATGSSESQPEVVVMSDVHIYDVPSRTWTKIPTAETPQGRYAHCATILPSSAVFTSADAPLAAIHNNPSSSTQNPHQGQIGVGIDGSGGAEMVIVGGQDSSNHYIEQISVFNLRSLKWTTTTPLGRQCGAYRSVIAPLSTMPSSAIGKGANYDPRRSSAPPEDGSSMLIYSNYNFLDVKLELHVRSPDGRLAERSMYGQVTPPGLRFPNGGVIDQHFVVSGTYLTSSKQEYALWALDLKTLTWARIDAGGSVFSQGSWNRGVLWNRRNSFVILGHRKRSLVDDYNHRRINFSHVCLVELEAFGLYDNPRKTSSTSGYVSVSASPMPMSLQPRLASQTGGGRPYSAAAERLGQVAMSIREVADMDLLSIDGDKIAVNSHMMARRWGPYFNQLLKDSTASADTISDAATLRPQMVSQASRNSSVTITPSIGGSSAMSNSTYNNLNPGSSNASTAAATIPSIARPNLNFEPPDTTSLPPTSRPRTLYLPHTTQTLTLLLNFLYTSSLPPPTSPSCTPQSLCSLLQLARPYQIDGLLECTVERLHQVLDGRNAAAVFNAAAMAAGGGRGTGQNPSGGTFGTLQSLNEQQATAAAAGNRLDGPASAVEALAARTGGLRINTSVGSQNGPGHERDDSLDSASTSTSMSSKETDFSTTDRSIQSESEGGTTNRRDDREREVWTGDVSSVVGLQKRGLRGLMEGRRLRERGTTNNGAGGGPPSLQNQQSTGSGQANTPGTNSQPGSMGRAGGAIAATVAAESGNLNGTAAAADTGRGFGVA